MGAEDLHQSKQKALTHYSIKYVNKLNFYIYNPEWIQNRKENN